MSEVRCRGRSAAWSIVLGALAMVAASLPAAARDHTPLPIQHCAGAHLDPALGRFQGRGAPVPALRPVLGVRGALTGHRVSLPVGRASVEIDLGAEAFVARGPAGLLVIGSDDGSESDVTVLDGALGCMRSRFTESDVVRGATVDPGMDAIYYHLVERGTRRDLGVRRRSLAGTAVPQQVLAPLPSRARTAPGDRIAATTLHWIPSGRLAVQSCARTGCRTRVLDPTTLDIRNHATPGQGEIVSVGPDSLIARRNCPVAPCPLMTIDLTSEHAAPTGSEVTVAGESRPTPSAGTVWGANAVLRYRWRGGAVPPGWMQPAIRAAADDITASRHSKAATFAYDADAPDTIGYETSLPCGATSIGCASKVVPDWWRVGLRVHGHWYDWGQLLWCQAQDTPRDGCFDAELVTLHELGHIEVLGHYEDAFDAGEPVGPWADSVMHEVTRAKPRAGWNAHVFGRCDVASLQRRYDVRSDTSSDYSTCVTLTTSLSLGASSTSVAYADPVVFTASLRVADRDGYGKLGGNRLSERAVMLQRRPAGGSTWFSLGWMSPTSTSGGYSFFTRPHSSGDYRAVFARPTDEGLTGATSVAVTVRVADCTGPGCATSLPQGPAWTGR
jgi:hypothetical protein